MLHLAPFELMTSMVMTFLVMAADPSITALGLARLATPNRERAWQSVAEASTFARSPASHEAVFRKSSWQNIAEPSSLAGIFRPGQRGLRVPNKIGVKGSKQSRSLQSQGMLQ